MGVHGLWQLLQPVGRPVTLESLQGKRLAIDSSIWLYHFQMAMRDRDGRTMAHAHLLGFLWRILKLLYYGIKPVFVFDGGAPEQKRRTLIQRKQRRATAAESYARTAEKLLAAQMRQAALSRPETLEPGTVFHDEVNAAPVKYVVPKDPYQLPAMPPNALRASDRKDIRLATEAELRALVHSMAPEDLDIHSDLFTNLPPELQYELVGDLRMQSRTTSYKRLQDMLHAAPTAIDFSKAQVAALKTRNDLTQKVLTVTDELGHANIPMRVEGLRNREYVLTHIDAGDGGFALGTRDAGTSREKPIVIEDVKPVIEEEDDEEEMDDVDIPTMPPEVKPISPPPHVELRELDEPAHQSNGELTRAGELPQEAPTAHHSSAAFESRGASPDLSPCESHVTSDTRHSSPMRAAASASSWEAESAHLEHEPAMEGHSKSPTPTQSHEAPLKAASRASPASFEHVPEPRTEERGTPRDSIEPHETPRKSERSTLGDAAVLVQEPRVQPRATSAKPVHLPPASPPNERDLMPLPTETHAEEIPTEPSVSPEPPLFMPSPSPPPLGLDGFPLSDTVEEEPELEADQTEFADFASATSGQSLPDMRRQVEADVDALRRERARQKQPEQETTHQMTQEIQAMLRLFGLPYITAPMEAEAQCAQLSMQHLVDGIITDDSDVFLFGGSPVYRHMFNHRQSVECYWMSDMERELGLSRTRLIQLAFLLGSDYTEGLAGVGPVLAMEILSLYPGDDALESFRDWWREVQMGHDTMPRSKVRARIQRALRDKVHLSSDWPDVYEREAYVAPHVDDSDEPFVWGHADLDAIRAFLHEYLHWPASKTDQYVLPVLEQQRKTARLQRVQATLDQAGFVGGRVPHKATSFTSTRLQHAVEQFRASKRPRPST